jgi:hypothetical protein
VQPLEYSLDDVEEVSAVRVVARGLDFRVRYPIDGVEIGEGDLLLPLSDVGDDAHPGRRHLPVG